MLKVSKSCSSEYRIKNQRDNTQNQRPSCISAPQKFRSFEISRAAKWATVRMIYIEISDGLHDICDLESDARIIPNYILPSTSHRRINGKKWWATRSCTHTHPYGSQAYSISVFPFRLGFFVACEWRVSFDQLCVQKHFCDSFNSLS